MGWGNGRFATVSPSATLGRMAYFLIGRLAFQNFPHYSTLDTLLPCFLTLSVQLLTFLTHFPIFFDTLLLRFLSLCQTLTTFHSLSVSNQNNIFTLRHFYTYGIIHTRVKNVAVFEICHIF